MRLNFKKICKLLLLFILLGSIIQVLKSAVTENLKQVILNDIIQIADIYKDTNKKWIKSERKHFNTKSVGVKNVTSVNSTCKAVLFPLHLARENYWQVVDKSFTAFIFSAYFDVEENKVKIIGIKSEGLKDFYCQFWCHSQGQMDVTMEEGLAVVIGMGESHGQRYGAVFFQCAQPSTIVVPTHVSLVTKPCETPQNMLVLQNRKLNTIRRKFTICLSPLNFQFDRDYALIEWIELNRIIGTDHFVVYNYSSGPNVLRVLDYYSKLGLLEVVQWDIPVLVDTPEGDNKKEIHYFGQVAALNECLYRNKHISEFVVNLDLDEFIIPHAINITTWSEMLELLDEKSSAYLFRNTFFKTEWNNEDVQISNKSIVDKLRLVTLQKLQHERKIDAPRMRSKYFARTNGTSSLMIHEVPGVKSEPVAINVGFLHHYRNWETVNDPPHVKILDKTVPKNYGLKLIYNVQKVWSDLHLMDVNNR